MLAWVILVTSGVFEAVWATALGKSDGFTKLTPTIMFFVALIISMAGLAYAMRSIPTGTAYVIWVGVGAVLTVSYAMTTGSESISGLKIALLLIIVAGIIGVKLLHD